jgi:hypothetical protein
MAQIGKVLGSFMEEIYSIFEDNDKSIAASSQRENVFQREEEIILYEKKSLFNVSKSFK